MTTSEPDEVYLGGDLIRIAASVDLCCAIVTTGLVLICLCSRCGIWLYNESLPPRTPKQNISNLMFNTMIAMMLVFIIEQFIWALFVQNSLSHFPLDTLKCRIFYPTHIMLYVSGKSILYLLFSFRLQAVFGNNSTLAYPRWVLATYQFLCTITPIGTAGAIIWFLLVKRDFIRVLIDHGTNISLCVPWQDDKFYSYFTASLIIYDAFFSFLALYLFVRKLYQIASLQRDKRSGSLVRQKKTFSNTPSETRSFHSGNYNSKYEYNNNNNNNAKYKNHRSKSRYVEYRVAGSGGYENGMERKYRWHNDMIDKNLRLLYIMKKSTFLVFVSIVSTMVINIGLGFITEKIGFFLVTDGLFSSLAAMSMFKFADPMYSIFCKPFEIILTYLFKCTCYCVQVYICCKSEDTFFHSDLNVIMSSDKIYSRSILTASPIKNTNRNENAYENNNQSMVNKFDKKIPENINNSNININSRFEVENMDDIQQLVHAATVPNDNDNDSDKANNINSSLSGQFTSTNDHDTCETVTHITEISVDIHAAANGNKNNRARGNIMHGNNMNNKFEDINTSEIGDDYHDENHNHYDENGNTLSSIFSQAITQTTTPTLGGSNTSSILQKQSRSETKSKTITSFKTLSQTECATDINGVNCSRELSVN